MKNTGDSAGAEVAEVYAMLPPSTDEPPQRLIGFDKVMLQPGESRELTVPINPLALTVYDEAKGEMKIVPGSYTIAVGGSSVSEPLQQKVKLSAQVVSK